jgi:hypothetical protein
VAAPANTSVLADLRIDSNVFYAAVIGTVAIILAIIVVVVKYERKKPKTTTAKVNFTS